MNHLKKLMLVVFAVNVLVVPVFAGLLEDADKLTPEQAVQLQQKLEQKRFEAMPRNTRMGGFVQFVDPSQFNNAFPTLNPIRTLYGGEFDLRYPLNKQFLIGGSFTGAGNYVFNSNVPKVYEDLFLAYGSAQLVLEYRIFQNKSFILSLTPGAGVMLGGFNYTKTDDNAKTYYETNRWGAGTCASLALNATWKISNEWGMGVGATYFSGKLSGMRKLLGHADASPDIDLSGTSIRISGSKTF